MSCKASALLAAAALSLLVLTTAARANGADDGNRGLNALQQGDYDGAIAAFTKALKFGRLSPEDQEFAYANRGRAYLRKGDMPAAIVDLDRARQMKPDDLDAQNDLLTALQSEIPPDSIPDRPHMSFLKMLGLAFLQGLRDGFAAALTPPDQQ